MDLRKIAKTSQALLARIASSHWMVWALVIGSVASVYREVCTFAFLPFWDDDTNIHRNPLYSPLTWASIGQFWRAPFQQLYIPVTYSFWGGLVVLSRLAAGTSLAVGPINPVFFHTANLLVHLVSTSLVYLILRRLLAAQFSPEISRSRLLAASALGSLAFAVHPVQVEAVAWVSGLRDLLGGAFSLAAIAIILSFLENSGCRNQRDDNKATRRKNQLNSPVANGSWYQIKAVALYLGATFFLLLAFGSKPASVVTPMLALLIGGWLLHVRHDSWRGLLWLIPWFFLALTEVVVTSRSQPAAELAGTLVPLWTRPLVAGDALAFSLGKVFLPVGLCADYGRSPNSIFDSGVLYWTWLLPAALFALIAFIRPLRCYLLPLGIFCIGLIPTLGLIPFNFQVVSTVSDHYLTLAMLGAALALAFVICRVSCRNAVIVSCILIPTWTILTLLQLPQWRDGNTFFPATLARNPTSWKSCHNYACTLDTQGKFHEALKEFEEAIRLRPSNAEAYNDMALTLLKLNRYQDACNAFQHSLQIRPTCGAARNLAFILLMTGNPAPAIQVYHDALQIDPTDLQNQRALAWVLATHPDASVRNGAEALSLAQQIVNETKGKVPVYLLTLSAALAETKDFDRAITVADQAAETYQQSGDFKTAGFIRQTIMPALRAHQQLRDNPVRVN